MDKWVRNNIYFSGRSSAVAGYWSDSRFPYSKGVLEAITDPHVREVVLNWGTQLGKTVILGSYVAWIAVNDPGPVLIACANYHMATEHYKVKLEPMLEACRATSVMLLPRHRRKMDLVDLGSMWVHYAYSGSKSTLSDRSIRFLLINEVNLWDRAKDHEGDPVRMARDRTKAFPNHKIIMEGKPTIVGECRITAAMERTDQRTFHLPCPECGHFAKLDPDRLRWDGGDDVILAKASAYFECESCGCRQTDEHRMSMISQGKWVAGRETDGTVVGFHLPSCYSSLLTWGDFAVDAIVSRQGTVADLQSHWNSWRAEAFEDYGKIADHEQVLSHRKDYKRGECPCEPLAIVVTADVQQDHCYYVVRAWAQRDVSWLLDWGVVLRLEDLAELKYKKYGDYSPTYGFIDSGYRTEEVYRFCLGARWISIKGGPDTQIQPAVWSKASGEKLLMVNSSHFKDDLQYRLFLGHDGAGSWNLPMDVDGDYVDHLLAEVPVEEEDANGYMIRKWKQIHRANHWLDCEVYQLAAALILGIRHWEPSGKESGVSGEPVASRGDGREWLEDGHYGGGVRQDHWKHNL